MADASSAAAAAPAVPAGDVQKEEVTAGTAAAAEAPPPKPQESAAAPASAPSANDAEATTSVTDPAGPAAAEAAPASKSEAVTNNATAPAAAAPAGSDGAGASAQAGSNSAATASPAAGSKPLSTGAAPSATGASGSTSLTSEPIQTQKVEQLSKGDNANPNKPGKLIGSDRPPLNVKDALSYLDSVKAKFLDKPEYYNSFLDIMKDFKTMVIDTPGVIDRVSSLFRHHPVLISNFNLFLPDGFRLDCDWDPTDSTQARSITVITPAGTQFLPKHCSSNLTGIDLPGRIEATSLTHAISGRYVYAAKNARPPSNKAAQTAKAQADKKAAAAEAKAKAAEERKVAAAKRAAAAKAAAIKAKETAAVKQPPQPAAQTSRTNTPTAAGPSAVDKRPAIEFNHAISYVNKIKTRFVAEPEIYKSFLDILQTYQKEQKPIQDVYAQVTKLFKTAPDLLDEFKQFLPDHSQEGREAAKEAADKKAAAQIPRTSQARAKPSGPPSVGSDDGLASGAVKRKRAPVQEKAAPVAIQPVAQPAAVPAKAVKARSRAAPGGPKDAPIAVQQSSSRFETIPGQSAAGPGYPQPILSYLPPGYTLPGTGPGATGQLPAPVAQETPEEKLFFDRIAEFIDDKFTYYEFLKLLNLYTQEIIDLPTLVSRAWLFIGSASDLWLDFREVVGWKDGNTNGRVIENGEWIVENVPAIDKRDKMTDLTRCEASGPSYRKLPKHEINMQCSGRDSLCWEVLNDEWVSVPNMGAEEVFLASKKNPFEEALHRSEDERHEYDFHIEANLRTIALLEPIAARIATMEPEERMTFRLKPGLGNQSKSIYQRIIKKVYGKEMGREVIQALHDNPCTSVPIVLARLKQKDEEWKRALREWNRVWREVDAKNFYRSLDHQGINFKAQDKRYIASKAMVSEIEIMRRTELQRQISAPPRYRPPPPTYQLAYPISDENVLFDSLKLFLSYLDRAPGYHTTAERDRIEAFLRSLTSLVFAIPVSVLDSMLTPVQDDSRSVTASEDEEGMSDSAASAGDGGLHPNGHRGRNLTPGHAAAAKKAADLRKKAMKNATGDTGKKALRAEGDATPMTSRDSTPVPQAATATISPVDTQMADADVQPSTTSDAQQLVEVQQNGESSYKVDVPASAAGLQGMSGVETVNTTIPVPQIMEVDQPAPTAQLASQATGAQADGMPAATPDQLLPPQRPDITHIQTKSETMLHGPAGVSASSLQAPAQSPGDSNVQPSQASPPISMLQNAQPRGEPQIRRFNFFCNTPYYCAIRLLHLLYSRLHNMKEAAKALGSTAAKDALSNSSFTTHGRANPRFSNQEPTNPTVSYDNMLELCEKLFGGELDQPTFEDSVRGLFGNKAYEIFTIDKLLSALVKTVWSLIDSNREAYSANGDIFKLLVDDRRYPTTAQAQQITYRINSELAAGSDENLYRVEWMPRRHLLTFQLLGKDEVLPEDEADLSKIWERYIESFINDEVTAGLTVDAKTIVKSARLARNLRFAEARRESLPKLVARSELESRICLRSYRIFWQGKTQDAMHRAWSKSTPAKMESVKVKRKERFDKWLEQRSKALEEATRSPIVAQKPDVSPSPAAASDAPPAEPAANKENAAKPGTPEVPAPAPAEGGEAVSSSKPADGGETESTKPKSAEPEVKQDSTGDVAMKDA